MDWRGRLGELKRAGGMVAMAVAMGGCMPGGCCNANPDPCCSAPKSQQCADYQSCLAKDAGVEACLYPIDLSVRDLATPADFVTVHDVGGSNSD